MLLSYKSDPTLKKDFLAEIEKHRKADQILQGTYGQGSNGNWKGCAVGCSVHSLNKMKHTTYSTDDHHVYETELGIPEWLARLEDTIFEGLPVKDAQKWVGQFAEAIPVGVNLEPVKWKFCAYLMKENINRVLGLNISDELKEQVVSAIRQVLQLHETAIKTGKWDGSAAESAAESAWSAAESAWSAAESAESAWSAWSAAESAWSAAESAESAWSAWSAAESAWSAWSAWSAAKSAANIKYSKKLLALLRAAK